MGDEKYFTVEEANRTLPLVKRIVADVVADYEAWRERVRKYELISGGVTAKQGESPEQAALREEVDELARRISGYVEELSQIGCVLKGFDDGLVDFHGKREGRDIFLCWKLGEDVVEHWHELDTGFAGRMPLVPETVAGEPE
jgi:hypothetical protein